MNLAPGESCTFGSPSLKVSPKAVATTTVVVNTSATTQGGGPVEVVANDGNIAKRPFFNVYVQPLLVNGTGNPQSTSPGTGKGGIVIVGLPPYVPSCSGLPAGVTCSFSGKQLPYPSDTILDLSIRVPSGLTPEAYPFTVSVKSGSVTISTPFTLDVTDFSVQSPSAASEWVLPGGTMNVGLGLQPVNGFDAVVDVTCSLDAGGSCTGESVAVSGAAVAPLNLVVSVPATVGTGAHTLTVNGSDGALIHTVAFPFYVADYSGSLSASSLTIAIGASASLKATVTATTGFAGAVSFGCSGSANLTCSFSPSTLQPTGNDPQTATVTVRAGASSAAGKTEIESEGELLALTLIFLFGVVIRSRGPDRNRQAAAFLFLLMLTLASLSCGGEGTTGGGGGGSSNYSLTVSATASGTNTTRALGTINVTVTH